MKGYLQVYTGDGKGKTTAALGLSLRAAGAGLNVYIAQFLKQGQYSENKIVFHDFMIARTFRRKAKGIASKAKGRPNSLNGL